MFGNQRKTRALARSASKPSPLRTNVGQEASSSFTSAFIIKTTPVKTRLAFSFGAKESPLFKIAEGIEDEEKILFEGKTAEVMTSLMPEILAEATTFLGNLDTAARLQFSQEQVLYYIGAWRQPSAASPLATEYISLSTFHISTTTTRLN